MKKLVEVFPAPRRKLEAELVRRKNEGFPISLKHLANEAIEAGLEHLKAYGKGEVDNV